MECILNNLKPLFDLFSRKKSFTFQKRSKKMLLHIRGEILRTRINNNCRKLTVYDICRLQTALGSKTVK